MYTCAGLIIYKSNFILLNISYQNEHLECDQNGAATAIPTALQRAGVIPNSNVEIKFSRIFPSIQEHSKSQSPGGRTFMIHAGPSSPGRGKFKSGVTGLMIPAKTTTNKLHVCEMQHDLKLYVP